MLATPSCPVAVLGGGLAGLTAASYLRRQGVPVVLFEAGKQIAGFARSFHDPDGFTYDFGAHFITNRLAAAVGISSRCRVVRRYSESVVLGKRTHSYPLGLMGVPRFAASAALSRVRALFTAAPRTAAEWFEARYGTALAREVAIPLTEAWSGRPAHELASSVGDSIPGSVLHTLFLKLLSRWTQRTVAIGYSREEKASPHVWHVYPEGGLSLLCEELARGLEGAIQLESPVEAILVENGRAVAVRVRGREQPVAAVVSTAPCNILPRLVQGTDAVAYASRFKYRPMVFVNLRLRGRGLLPDVVTWTPENHYPFFRLTETPLSMPWLAPEGKTLVTVDIGCAVGDPIWNKPDEALGDYCLEHLQPLIRDVRRRYLGCRVLRTPIAYPVFGIEYEADRLRFGQGLGIDGLISIGRNGEFMHIFMEDVYWRTLKRCQRLLSDLERPARSVSVGYGGIPFQEEDQRRPDPSPLVTVG